MSVLSLVARGIYWTLGAAQTAVELVGSGRRLVKQARQGALSLDETDPMPLTQRDVSHQQSQIRAATSPVPRR